MYCWVIHSHTISNLPDIEVHESTLTITILDSFSLGPRSNQRICNPLISLEQRKRVWIYYLEARSGKTSAHMVCLRGSWKTPFP